VNPEVVTGGSRVEELLTKDAIDALMKPEAQCCRRYQCLRVWKKKLGDKQARAIIETERSLYAGMSECQRKTHYMTVLSTLREPIMATSSVVGQGKHHAGKRTQQMALALRYCCYDYSCRW
jgi:hypothetical protein